MLLKYYSIAALICATLSRASNITSFDLNLNSTSSYLRGIDVSHYQGNINWSKVATSGIKFACAKATEGITYVDPSFSANWVGMKSVGLTRCAYHFAHPKEDAATQVIISFLFLKNSFFLFTEMGNGVGNGKKKWENKWEIKIAS